MVNANISRPDYFRIINVFLTIILVCACFNQQNDIKNKMYLVCGRNHTPTDMTHNHDKNLNLRMCVPSVTSAQQASIEATGLHRKRRGIISGLLPAQKPSMFILGVRITLSRSAPK